jgi:hypothetical protein
MVERHTGPNGRSCRRAAPTPGGNLITDFGLNPEKISSIGYGEAHPVAINDTAEGRATPHRPDPPRARGGEKRMADSQRMHYDG